MIGKRFERLLVIANAPTINGRKRLICHCDCGAEINTRADGLIRGRTKSCGCYRSDAAKTRFRTHGKTGTSEHGTWTAIKQRCLNPSCDEFRNYGERGIRICDRWALSFEAFYTDMGSRPKGMEIERIDNNGNYEPSNCRWANRKEQTRNTRVNHLITWKGHTKPLCDWEKETGIHRDTIGNRLKRGWTVEDALTKPAAHG